MKKLPILVLLHKKLIPPENIDESNLKREKVPWKTEYDIISNLKKMGHDVAPLGIDSDLRVIRTAIFSFKPTIIFNLLEEFDGEALFDQNVVSYLELLKVSYTGCNPRGLIIARDKALAKKILIYHKINTPRFEVFPMNKANKSITDMKYPMIVKCLNEEASLGIAQASIVHSKEKLIERIDYINKKMQLSAIAEEFIEGREFSVGILGNHKLEVMPIWELKFKNSKNPQRELYTASAKFNEQYRKQKGITNQKADISDRLAKKIIDTCKETYKILNLSGYARIDLRVDDNEDIFILEANPNPDISIDDEFATSAKYAGINYQELLEKVIKLGQNWNPYSN